MATSLDLEKAMTDSLMNQAILPNFDQFSATLPNINTQLGTVINRI